MALSKFNQVKGCLFQCGEPCTENDEDYVSDITKHAPKRWENFEKQAYLWRGLDRFGEVYATDWKKGSKGHVMHDQCRIKFMSERKLKQAMKRKEKTDLIAQKEREKADTASCSKVEDDDPLPRATRSHFGPSGLHDKNKCVWCFKPPNTKHPDPSNPFSCIEYKNGWEKFKRHTIYLSDPLQKERINRLIETVYDDPYAAEIRYHHKCWMKHVTNVLRKHDDEKDALKVNVSFREAQTEFFDIVEGVIFEQHEIRSLQSLKHEYKRIISMYGFHVDGVQSSYVKDILKREFKERIGFHSRPQKNLSELVYDTAAGGSYIETALTSIGISSDQLIDNLSKRIISSVKETGTITWPPTVDELEEEETLDPLLLNTVRALARKSKDDMSPDLLSLTSLLTQLILKEPTPTAIRSTVTRHGISRSREMVDIDSKLGIGIRYEKLLFLRDTWALHDMQSADDCPRDIAEGKPGIGILDNDDFREDTLTGEGTSHRTNYMLIQKEKYKPMLPPIQEEDEERNRNPRIASIALKQAADEMQKVQPYKTIKRGEPPIRTKPNDADVKKSTLPQRKRNVIHALCRVDSEGNPPNPSDQKVPAYNGFHASISKPQDVTKAHYVKSYDQPPNKSVVNDVMETQNNIMRSRKMPFSFLVGDLPVFNLEVEIKSESPNAKFDKLNPFLSPWHGQCVMMATIFKRYKGSELEEILVQAGVIGPGSVEHALSGKHYRRGMRSLRIFSENLMRRLTKGAQLGNETKQKLETLRDTTKDQLIRAQAHEELMEEEEIEKLIEDMFLGLDDSDMASYWEDFLDMTDGLFMNAHACHAVDFDEYVVSLRAMLPWMLTYDKQKYGRALPDFWAYLINLPPEEHEFLRENFALSLTGNPYSGMPWDLWIEVTMNKGSKLKSGWLSMLKNEKQLLVHSRNVNNIARIRVAHNKAANKKAQKWKHIECRPKRMKEDEQMVQNIAACLEEFDCDPFDPENPILRTMVSAVPASEELVKDFQSAKEDGEKALETFLEERVYSRTKSFHDRMKKMNRKTFATASSDKPASGRSKQKVAEIEQEALKSVINLVDRTDSVDLETLMNSRVTDECLSLFNPDGTIRKNAKSQLISNMKLETFEPRAPYIAILDMGHIWRLSIPNPGEKSPDSDDKFTWKDFGDRLSDIAVKRHSNANLIICVNDVYDYENCTKDDERARRAEGYGQIPNEFFKPESDFPSKAKLARILSKSENKIRLQKFTLKVLQQKMSTHNKTIMFSTGMSCINLRTMAQEQHLQFRQAEADTIMFSIHDTLRSQGVKADVIFDTRDTDLYVTSAYQSHLYDENMGIKRGKDYINCKELVEDDMIHCIVPLALMTGGDNVAGFYGKGKGVIYKRVKKSNRAQEQLEHCGEDEVLEESCVQELLSFTREAVYGDFTSRTMGQARAKKWRSQKNKSISRLPPDEDSLRWKIKRANYQAYLMRNPTLREHPDAVGNGWELVNGVCKPVRYSKPPLPHHLNQQDVDVEDMDIDQDDTGLDEENSDLDVDESDNETLSVLSEGELEYEDVDIGSDDSSDEDY